MISPDLRRRAEDYLIEHSNMCRTKGHYATRYPCLECLRIMFVDALTTVQREERESTTKRLLEISQGAIRCKVEDEREACARVAEQTGGNYGKDADNSVVAHSKKIATAIRSRI